MPLRDLLLTLAVVLVWGTSFVAIQVGVETVPPLLLTGLRFLFTALPALVFVARPKVGWGALLAYGSVLGVLKFGALFVAMAQGMPIGLTSIVVQVQVFFTVAIAAFVLGERPSRATLIGGAIAFVGMGLFAIERGQGAPLGPFLLVVAAFWGLANVIGKAAGVRDMFGFVIWSSLVPPLPLFALSWVLEGPAGFSGLASPSLPALLALAYMSLLATVFGFGMWATLLARHPTSRVTPFALLIPLVGFFWGIALGETVSLLALAASGIVFLGLLVHVFGDRLPRKGAPLPLSGPPA